MRILYVAKHGSGGNDDEGAVAHALFKLGHEVVHVHERDTELLFTPRPPCDFLLFHGWHDLDSLRRVAIPKVCWFFDLVDSKDPSLAARDARRREWSVAVHGIADLCFHTDGDWVIRHNAERAAVGKYPKGFWLPQGCDERVSGPGRRNEHLPPVDLLFTGISRGGGTERERWVSMMEQCHGDRFHHVSRNVHGRALADLIANSKIVLAPGGPVTDLYWSNRVYLACGFGAFLLHPYSHGLDRQVEATRAPGSKVPLVFYYDNEQLHHLIGWYMQRPAVRQEIATAAVEWARAHHTYRHRCEELVRTVKERLPL